MINRSKLWSRHGEALITVALFLGAVGLYSLTWFHGVGKGGISTVGAIRVLEGEIPYRDFWTMYAPGSYYLLALLFRIFGTHLLVEVVAASVVCAIAACICYRLVVNLTGRRLAALTCAGIFLAAIFNTGYYRSLGTYPPAILFIFAALNLMVLYYKAGKLSHLIMAGLATAAVVAFKHDIGGYTAIAIVTGLVAHHVLAPAISADRKHVLLLKLFAYSAGFAAIVLPLLIYFAALAGPDMWQDLIVFPATDFRFSRGGSLPGLFPFGIYDEFHLKMLFNIFRYVKFTVPFVVFLLGVIAIGLAVGRRKLDYVALGVTFSVAYLLHYAAAHVKINTHIVSMSVYAACLGVIFYDLADGEFALGRPTFTRLLSLALVTGWFISLAGEPAPKMWESWKQKTAELKLPKVSGIMVSPKSARKWTEMSAFVDAHIPPDQKLFVGLHRHDVVIVGTPRLYFFLDRANATRYHELHPAIVDTARVQREIISDLQRKNVTFVILKHIFSDEALDEVKKAFLRNLPEVGATDLDEFIQANYVEVRKFGRYVFWARKDVTLAVVESHAVQSSKPGETEDGRISRSVGVADSGSRGDGRR